MNNLTPAAPLAALTLILTLLMTWPGQAAASALNDFNLIVLDDIKGNASGHVDGRVIVFGDVYGSSQVLNSHYQSATDPVNTQGLNQSDGLIVGRQIVSGTVMVQGADVRVGGSQTGAKVDNDTSETYNDASVAELILSVRMEIDSLETTLKGLTADSDANYIDINTAVLNANPGDDSIAVFDLKWDNPIFSSNAELDLTGAEDADLIVIRIETGTNFTFNSSLHLDKNEFGLEEYQSKIIWYMPDVTDLYIAGALGGTLIAPNANLTFSNNLMGTVVVNTVTLGGEIHLPSLDTPALDTPQPSPVPEPSSLILLGLGALVLLAAGRRRLHSKAGSAFQM